MALRDSSAAWNRSDSRAFSSTRAAESRDIPPVGQPAMSHDLKYLFFCLAGDMYWVDAGFLAEVREESLRE